MSVGSSGIARAPQQERSRRVVRRLLDAAEVAFAEEGYDRASVRSIAASAGVPKGSVYQFFTSKEGLLDAVEADLTRELGQAFEGLATAHQELLDGNGSLQTMVGHVIGEILELAARRPVFATLFSGQAAAGPLAAAGARMRDACQSQIEAVMQGAEPPPTIGVTQVATVCTEIIRGLLPRIVDADGTVDPVLGPELSFAVAAYLASVRDRSPAPNPGQRPTRRD
ncbi:MAG: TetR/AcrR family transcriptional regulator [Actinomycetota bacterium]